ncbi:TIGR04219 family outer membrane beta-barrel protein [Pseudoalteromonas sp. JBTF-M23]|uniref:TIGR04219 family outer membrane beta-barrel protein n=1 Tax=Pseudoalteromonas caenipelagi TaxID=2726988 RepID=A0A849VDI7_9GAMM|nr:TIGR04219 family outer membrane beta-barrel protein [Pseudoalteromonas caenipelagi]NOU51749.1 TIGR04219 family outer membrane beta-barrel protein [Pseudoalteromonas caenipelagi]
MKKYCIAAALSMACLAPVAQADTLLGLYLGAQGWQADNSGSFAEKGNAQTFNFDDKTFSSYYAALEHPIPLVPNIKLRYTELELDGSTTLSETFEFGGKNFTVGTAANTVTDLNHVDYTLYYEIFDNDLVSFDFGINVKQFDGSIKLTGTAQGVATTEMRDFSGLVPLGYLKAQVGLPMTGFSVFAEGSMLAIDDSKIQDYQVGVAWEVIGSMAVDVSVKAGFRSMVLELDDVDDISTDIDASGPFAGVEIHF